MNTLKVFTAFSGYDSQCMALDRLNINYELIGWSEIDKYAIQAHNAVYPQYADRNYGDISKIDWMKVPDFDLFTYSFPCTDISSAGQQKGLTEGSGTRSSLLWECRKAIEIKRPKYLLMENVKALTSEKFLPYLQKWLLFLESMGYSNFTKVLNSKDYGVPQNRERVFCVSIFGDERYYFPKPFKLEKRLKDVLENNVDERYYLSKKMIQCFVNRTEIAKKKGNGFRFYPTDGNVVAKAITTCAGNRTDDNFIYGNKRLNAMIDKNIIDKKRVQYLDTYNMRVYDDVSGTITTRIDAANNTYITEPKSCAMRGRNHDNPSDRTSGIPTEQRIEMGGDIANCLTTVQKDSLVLEPSTDSSKTEYSGVIGISVHPNGRKMEFKGESSVKEICPALRATDYKCPSCVWELKGNLVAEQILETAQTLKAIANATHKMDCDITINPDKSLRPYKNDDHKSGISELQTDYDGSTASTLISARPNLLYGNTTNYSIRKLTPRECFRLMGVSESDIDKIQNAGISKTQQYKMAGNSIVVDVLYHIFRKLFIDKEQESIQLTLF